MISSVGLVVLICAVAVNALAHPQCNAVGIDEILGSETYTLEPAFLQPSIRDYKINIPHVPQCTNGEIGVRAIICDDDVAPIGKLVGLNTLFINRRGNLENIGSVSVTVYCRN
ncbi:hypothetical protein SFRURICE_005451 [Spodoptera frugiperda]|nr:hypothetical protein SFRURICE_005451 [Spodoptera frugiperda]